MSITFKQGEDKKIVLTVTETPTINFSSASQIIVILQGPKKIEKKYALTTITDYGTLLVGTLTNTIEVFVERSHSKLFDQGVLTATLLASFTDTDPTDGKLAREWVFNGVATIQEGRGKDEIL